MFNRLTETVSVAPQIAPEDCATAAAQGFTVIINNRPEDEVPGQPAGAGIAAAAAAAGLRYVAIPVDHSGISLPQIEAMQAELAAPGAHILAFCRSGTRSCHLWALASAKSGAEPEAIVSAAAEGGYDLASMAPVLKHLATAG